MKIWKCAVVLSAAIMTSVTAHSDSLFPGGQYYSEDFEAAADYGENIIFTEVDGNHALRVSDGFSEPVCTPPANMLLEGKFKVLDRYENRSCFEIIPKSNKKGDEYFGGWRYNIFSIDLQRSFISSGSSIGGDVEIGGGWNYFKISTLGRKTIFEVNGTILCADSAQALPELVFRAEGCDVLVDDLQISKIITGGATYNGLAAAKTEHTISAHEPYDFLRESGLYRLYSGGTRVNDVNIDDVDYAVYGEYKELSRGYGYFYGKSEVVFAYQGKSCSIEIDVDDNKPKGQHLCDTTYKRRQKLARAAYDKLNMSGYRKNSAGYSALFELMSAAYLYPSSENHDEIIGFLLQMAEETDYHTRGSVGAEDFIAIDLLLACKEERLNISEELRLRLERFFTSLDFSCPAENLSENHRMTYYAIGILAFEVYPGRTFFNGLSSEQNEEIYKKYILDWIDFRLNYGMGEYDSSYYIVDFAALETIYTNTNDIELKRRVYEILMYLYTDVAVNANNSVMGGAQSRVYVNQKAFGRMQPLNVLFGDSISPEMSYTMQMLPFCSSEFVPQQSLAEQRVDSDSVYESIEKRRVYTIPDDPALMGELVKYTYVTPEYIIGTVLKNDNLPEEAVQSGDKYYVQTGTYDSPTRILPDFQSVDFNISIRGNPLLNIIYSHPGGAYTALGGAHSYFAGDHGCHCTRYMQRKNTALGMTNITDMSLPQFSHFYINKGEFDEVIEKDGWVIVRSGDVYAALCPLSSEGGGYEWGSDSELFDKTPLSQLEIKINSPRSAFAAEVYSRSEIGSFDSFIEAVLGTQIEYDGETLRYISIAGDSFEFGYNDIAGAAQTGYSDSGNCYMDSVWGSTMVSYPDFDTPGTNYVSIYKTGVGKYKVIPMTEEGRLFTAVYDNNGFMQSVEEHNGKGVFEVSGNNVKAFAVDSIERLHPLTRQWY